MIHRETPDAPYSPEVEARIRLNSQRLREPYYQLPDVFQAPDADWPGDKEGRALLAFVSHYKMTREKNPAMEPLLREMPNHTNESLYFGPAAGEMIHEQQLSGHSWLLRGLCEHYEQFRDEFSLKALISITEGLFLPTKGAYPTYPVDRDTSDGGVSGHSATVMGRWILSTDVGCAFMSIDGLSHVYKITGDPRVLALLDEMIEVYSKIDKVALKVQTHCTLTAARGMLRLYNLTEDSKYLIAAKDIFHLYAFDKGMDAAYQNLNWWGRPNTWTEPCAIVDSLMVSLELYKITRKDSYRRCAARIFHNGLASAQRSNGGAGTDAITIPDSEGQESLYLLTYEAPFCCTMRLAEGLWYIHENVDMLYYEIERKENGQLWIVHDEFGRYMCGDLVLCEASLPEGVDTQGWEMPAPVAERHGHKLIPLVKFYKTPDSVATQLKQRIIFQK